MLQVPIKARCNANEPNIVAFKGQLGSLFGQKLGDGKLNEDKKRSMEFYRKIYSI